MENEISILVIEDEALIAETIRWMLEDFGYHVTGVCYSYDAALEAIEKGGYDLVLTDINLGDGIEVRSGFDLMATLSRTRKCPFIFLTAFDGKDIIRKAAMLHPSAYLTKPINAPNLYASVQLAVENFKNDKTSLTGKTSYPDYIYIKLGKRVFKVLWEDVYYLESIKNYVLLKTPEFDSGLLIRSSLLQIMEQMIPLDQRSRFVKISRSIAIDHSIISSFSDQNVHTRYGVFKCTAEFRESIAQ